MARLRSVDGVVPAVLADGKRGGPGGGAGRRIDMDAVEFIRERNRMCKHFRGCAECPAGGMICSTIWGMNDTERLVQVVEEWAKEHPHKTRQSEFLERWPEARIDKATGVLTICPAELTKECRDDRGACGAYSIETCVCEPCRREFWTQEVE